MYAALSYFRRAAPTGERAAVLARHAAHNNHPHAAAADARDEPGSQFTTQFACFTSTKVQILTSEELLFLQGVELHADLAARMFECAQVWGLTDADGC